MGRGVTEKTIGNKYYQARIAAAEYNEKLKSRPGAAEELHVSADSLANYELGICKAVPVDVVVRMADLYNAPELLNSYCTEDCPAGKLTQPVLELKPVERLTLQLLRNTNDVDKIRNTLAEITADGIIDNAERPKLNEILEYLQNLEVSIREFKLWAEKFDKGSDGDDIRGNQKL